MSCPATSMPQSAGGAVASSVLDNAGPEPIHRRLLRSPPAAAGRIALRRAPATPPPTHRSTWCVGYYFGTVGDALGNALMGATIGPYQTEPIKARRPWRGPADLGV